MRISDKKDIKAQALGALGGVRDVVGIGARRAFVRVPQPVFCVLEVQLIDSVQCVLAG